MQWCLGAALLILTASCLQQGMCFPGAPRCDSAALEEDPRAARFCNAVFTFLEFYAEAGGLEDKPPVDYQALMREYPKLVDTNMKRQDVAHSFLRFGRRRR